MKKWHLALGASGLVALGALGFAAGATVVSGSEGSVREALAQRLPNTQISAVDCDEVSGLCAVEAGSNLFYVDRSGRFLIVGRVYDMETRQDLTAARLLEMNPDMLLGGAAAVPSSEEEGAPASAPSAKIVPSDLAALPASGAIEHGSGPRTLTVFSDFRCGYCRQLFDELGAMDVKVIERPISILGSRALSEDVICARDPKAAVSRAYEGAPVGARKADCDTRGLDANEAFARAKGFTGTPVIVREDGAVISGYRPRAVLETWLKGGES